jgi:hypothetical protein
MSSAKYFVNCDKLELLPELNRRNYLFELDLLEKRLPQRARVLQVGSNGWIANCAVTAAAAGSSADRAGD